MKEEEEIGPLTKLPGKHFDQVKENGNLSPLRGSISWENVHNEAVTRKQPVVPLRFDDTKKNTIGHTKCYYDEMSSVVRSKLAGLMIMVAEEETAIERQRQSLAKNFAFEPYAAFSRIDRENKGFICGKEIKNFLIENGYHHLLEAETNYIVKYFDSCPTEHAYNRLDYQE